MTLGRNWIEMADDGHGSLGPVGHGLTGLRERVEAARGSVQVGGNGPGWRLRAEVALPVAERAQTRTAAPTVVA